MEGFLFWTVCNESNDSCFGSLYLDLVANKSPKLSAHALLQNLSAVCGIGLEEKKPPMSRMKAQTNKCIRDFRIRGLFVESELKKKGHEWHEWHE